MKGGFEFTGISSLVAAPSDNDSEGSTCTLRCYYLLLYYKYNVL